MKQDIQLYKEWFEEIAEKASRLTTGNVSHLGSTIRGLALNCIEYIGSQEPSLKIKGWVTRDENGGLCLWRIKPEREAHSFGLPCEMGVWLRIDESLFTNLRWEDEPIEVEIVIGKYKNENQ